MGYDYRKSTKEKRQTLEQAYAEVSGLQEPGHVAVRMALIPPEEARTILAEHPHVHIEIITVDANHLATPGYTDGHRLGDAIRHRAPHMIEKTAAEDPTYVTKHVVMRTEELDTMRNEVVCSTCGHQLGRHSARPRHGCLIAAGCSCEDFTVATAVPRSATTQGDQQ